MGRILVVDDEEGVRSFVAESLELEGHAVEEAESGEAAQARMGKKSFELVITDLRMPGISGLDLLTWIQAEQPEVEVIVLTAHGNVETAVEAMKLGAFDYVQKPVSSPTEIRVMAARALERRALRDLQDRTRDPASPPVLSYGDPAMAPVVSALEKVARTHATVLLLGESGTGKEVAARAIHAMSQRSSGPFVAVNCATLSANLLESELFGHEKGAFTGATERKRGRIELADGGTFFLDEVGELALDLQAKLLRVLQERTFERVGGNRSIDVDVRWVAATNRDLQTLIEQGKFRDDLYHRLAVFPVRLPPLRDRPADIPALAEVLLARAAHELKRPGLTLTGAARALLAQAPWPGNIRELANVLERAAILADGQEIDTEYLLLEPGRVLGSVTPAPASASPSTAGSLTAPSAGATGAPSDHADPETASESLPETLEDIEKLAIERALTAVDGNRRKAAARLGIGLRTLYDKIKRLKIEG